MRENRDWSLVARARAAAAALGLLIVSTSAPATWAFEPVGACCFGDGSCANLIGFQCDTAGGDFIGDGTLCANVNCQQPVAAPLLSAAGLIAAASALAAIGIRGALARYRR